jgi:restriction system protein
VAVYFTRDNTLPAAYSKHFQFKWIYGIVVLDYASINAELFEQIAKSPEFLNIIGWREFEVLLDAIFRNHGYRTELGPGRADGGVDLRLYQHDIIGEIVTLVQARRYAKRPVHLEAVAALAAHADFENANRALFVTTSRYLPSAQRFAAEVRSG